MRQPYALLLPLSLALLLRLGLLIKADWMADYDESVIGLMGLEILDGRRPIFFAGQPYLGALDAYIAAGLFSLFGSDRALLKLVPLGFSLFWVATTLVLARRLLRERAVLVAGLVAAFAPIYVLDVTLKAGIGVVETMALGNVIWLSILSLVDAREHRQFLRWAGTLGFAAGIAFWLDWLIAYYLVSGAVYLGIHGRHLVRRSAMPSALAGVAAFLVGSAPFWVYNLRTGWATFRYFWDVAQHEGPRLSRAAILWDWLSLHAPKALGASLPALPWLSAATVAALAGALLLLCMGALRSSTPPAQRGLRIVPLFVLSMPLLYLLSGFGGASFAFKESFVDATGRYVVPLFAVAPLAVAFLYQRVSARFGLACLGAVAAVTAVGVWTTPSDLVFQSPYYNRTPASFTGVIAALDEAGVEHVWTDVALAHPLMFQSLGRIKAGDYLDRINGGAQRFPDAYRAVEEASRTAYLAAVIPGQIGPLERAFVRLAVGFQKCEVGRLALFVPDRRVNPQEVEAGLGYQY